jgi:alkylhydroperoxidase family enzyme
MNTDTYTILWESARPDPPPGQGPAPTSRPVRRKGFFRRTWKALARALSFQAETKKTDPHASRMALLTERVLTSPGILEPHVREGIAAGRAIPPALAAYLEKVNLHAYKITDEDVEELKRAGLSEDEIFEATVSAALGAGLKRLRAGLDSLWGV